MRAARVCPSTPTSAKLRYGEKLGDTLVEACELLDELGGLITKRSILTSQRFEHAGNAA